MPKWSTATSAVHRVSKSPRAENQNRSNKRVLYDDDCDTYIPEPAAHTPGPVEETPKKHKVIQPYNKTMNEKLQYLKILEEVIGNQVSPDIVSSVKDIKTSHAPRSDKEDDTTNKLKMKEKVKTKKTGKTILSDREDDKDQEYDKAKNLEIQEKTKTMKRKKTELSDREDDKAKSLEIQEKTKTVKRKKTKLSDEEDNNLKNQEIEKMKTGKRRKTILSGKEDDDAKDLEMQEKTQIGKPVMKNFVRYDPEDESAADLEIKVQKPNNEEEEKEANLESMDQDEENASAISTSKELFYEVSSDLKSVLESSSGQFSLSQRFDKIEPLDETDEITDVTHFSINEENNRQDSEEVQFETLGHVNNLEKVKRKIKFFFSEDDPRLKEGVEFFMRSKPLNILVKDWEEQRLKIIVHLRSKENKGNTTGNKTKRGRNRKGRS